MTSNEVHDELAKTLMRERDKHPRHPEDIDSYVLADAILASPLLDRIKREAAAEALEEFANEYQETRIRVSIASPNVGDYWAGAHIATGHAVDSLRSHAEFLRKGHE